MIESLLSISVLIDQITKGQYFKEMFGELPIIRDNCIMRKDVANIENRIKNMKVQKCNIDSQSVNFWYQDEKQKNYLSSSIQKA